MIGSFLTRILIMALGYAYPGYECYKTVEKNKPEIEQLRFWCQYWILVALLTIFERVGDNFISWLPMYSEAKLALFVYLWYPKTRGTLYIYGAFFRPYMVKHESEIDKNLHELKTSIGNFAVLYWQKAASYGQTRFFEVLQYVASQSQSSRPPTAQPLQVRQSQPNIVPTVEPDAHHQPRQATTSQPSQSLLSDQTLEPIQPTVISPSKGRAPEELSDFNVPKVSQRNGDGASSSSHTPNGNGFSQAETTTEGYNRTLSEVHVEAEGATRATGGRQRKKWLLFNF